MLQDRNIHRDAQALRKAFTIPIIAPAFGVDQDEPQWVYQPRYNWRLSDLSFSRQALTQQVIVKAQAVPPGAAVGSPQLSQAAAVTFAIEEFWRHNGNQTDFSNIAAVPAQAFDELFTILDGFWGVVLVLADSSNQTGTIVNGAIQGFATEEIALANCPKVRPFPGASGNVGRAAILTINAVGGDFIAGTTNTDAGLVAAFNTAPQDGHVVVAPIDNSPEATQSVLGQQLKDASETNILQGVGGAGSSFDNNGDALVVSIRAAIAPVITGGLATVEIRPWPAGGEGVGDASVSQNRPSFVP